MDANTEMQSTYVSLGRWNTSSSMLSFCIVSMLLNHYAESTVVWFPSSQIQVGGWEGDGNARVR